MSFDVYVQFFAGGQETGIPEAAVRAAFPGLVEVLDDDYWLLRFGADDTTDLFLGLAAADPHGVHTLSFHRPGSDARLWDGIWQLLVNPGAVYFYPESRALVRDAVAIAHLPDAMLEARGGAVVLTDVGALPPTHHA